MAEITTTLAHVVGAMIQRIKILDPSVNVMYDPSLSYESGVRSLPIWDNVEPSSITTTQLPALFWNRSVLRRPDGSLRHANHTLRGNSHEAYRYSRYRGYFAEFDFSFLYCVDSLKDLEVFEILYSGEYALNVEKTISIDFGGDVGVLDYRLDWQPLDDLQIEVESSYYKAIGASCKVQGYQVIDLSADDAVILYPHLDVWLDGHADRNLDDPEVIQAYRDASGANDD